MVRFRDARRQRPFHAPRMSSKPKRCIWCNRKFGRNLKPTREHIQPRSLGGGGGSNLTAACGPCNWTRKSDTTWKPFGSTDMPEHQLAHLRGLKVIKKEVAP